MAIQNRFVSKINERFFSKIRIDPETQCWLWTAGRTQKGYGEFNVSHASTVYAHRFMYELTHEKIPKGFVIDHLCRVRHCVNPEHLRVVTHRLNLTAEGSLSPAKWGPERTHCKYGHPLTKDNVYQRKGDNRRECRECIRVRNRRDYYRKKET